MSRRLVVAIMFILGAVSMPAFARLRQLWSEQQIADKSDLIVMAKAVEVRDTGIKTTIPNIRRGNDPVGAVEMETTFEVLAVLKGKIEGARLVLYHLREAKN